MTVRTYVVIRDNKIVGGPYRWNGMTDWSPPEEGMLVLEEEAERLGITERAKQEVIPDETRKTEETPEPKSTVRKRRGKAQD